MAAKALTREEQLAWEDRWSKPAAASAIGFVVLTLASMLVARSLYTGPLGPAGPEMFIAISQQQLGWIAVSVVQAIPFLMLIPVLLYLERAAAFRTQVMKAARVLAVLGPLLWVGFVVADGVARANLATRFAATPAAQAVAVDPQPAEITASSSPQEVEQAVVEATTRTAQVNEAGDAFEEMVKNDQGQPVLVGAFLAASLALGFALVLISQAGLKAGLTSRFLGYVGVGVGALYGLIAILQFPPLALQVFWLGALALVFLDRWPNGRGPAWDTGTAKAWPSAAEQREAYERRVQARQGQLQAPPEAAGDEPPAQNGSGDAAPGARKKKKRR